MFVAVLSGSPFLRYRALTRRLEGTTVDVLFGVTAIRYLECLALWVLDAETIEGLDSMNRIRQLSIVAVVLLAGCASGFEKYYMPNTKVSPDLIAARRPGPPPAMPDLMRTAPSDGPSVRQEAIRRGFIVIGVSMFHSVYNENAETALKQGKKVGADLVLLFDPTAGPSFTQMVAVNSPFQATASTTTRGSAHGAGGSAYGTSHSTTNITGSTTSYVPQTVQHTNYGAVFLAKQIYPLGVDVRDLDATEKRTLQRNRGVVVDIVVNESPAYFADIMEGDIITSFAGEEVTTKAQFDRMVEMSKGRGVNLVWLRDGKSVEKAIQMQ